MYGVEREVERGVEREVEYLGMGLHSEDAMWQK